MLLSLPERIIFRPDYLKLGSVRSKLGNVPCVALTATATKKVQRDIINILKVRRILILSYYNVIFTVNVILKKMKLKCFCMK